MTQTLEGTWEELAAHASELRGKRLRLVVMEEAMLTVPQDAEAARIAAILADLGKFAEPSQKSLASEELRHERQIDEAKFESDESGENT